MGKTILDIRMMYEKFGSAEKKIADFLLSRPHEIVPLSITELSEKCGCSEATVVRFSKKLGFEGYQQLKISVAREDNVRARGEKITGGDDAFDVFSKVCDEVYCSLEQTKKAIDRVHLQRCCEAIMGAKRIYVFGLGSSAPVSLDAAHKFLRLGFDAHAYTDNHMQAIAASHTSAGDVVIGISHSGSSKDIVQALTLAKERGAKTVAVTNFGKSPINRAADIVLNTVSDETNYDILGLRSRIAQLTIIDSVYSYIVSHLTDAGERINKTEAALLKKKY